MHILMLQFNLTVRSCLAGERIRGTVNTSVHQAQNLNMDPSALRGAAVIEFPHFWHLSESDTLSHEIPAVLNGILLICCQRSHYLWHVAFPGRHSHYCLFRSAINGAIHFFQRQYRCPSFEMSSYLPERRRCDAPDCDKLTAEPGGETNAFYGPSE